MPPNPIAVTAGICLTKAMNRPTAVWGRVAVTRPWLIPDEKLIPADHPQGQDPLQENPYLWSLDGVCGGSPL